MNKGEKGIKASDKKEKKIRISQVESLSGYEQTLSLISGISVLSESYHTRLMSHLRSIVDFVDRGDEKYIDSFPLLQSIRKEVNEGGVKDVKENLIASLKKKTFASFYWAYKYYNVGIFEILRKEASKKKSLLTVELINLGEKWYKELKTLKESFLTYYTLIAIHLSGATTSGTTLLPDKEYKEITLKIYSRDDISALVDKNLQHKIKFDEYVYDMHTKEGRTKGKGGKVFALEGSVVENEFKISIEEFERFYVLNKLFRANDKLYLKYLKPGGGRY